MYLWKQNVNSYICFLFFNMIFIPEIYLFLVWLMIALHAFDKKSFWNTFENPYVWTTVIICSLNLQKTAIHLQLKRNLSWFFPCISYLHFAHCLILFSLIVSMNFLDTKVRFTALRTNSVVLLKTVAASAFIFNGKKKGFLYPGCNFLTLFIHWNKCLGLRI